MGERISASFTVAGNVKREHAIELCEIAEGSYGMTWDGDKPALDNIGNQWGWNEVNYGNLDDLVDYCRANGIDYEYWFDSGSEWTARTERHVNGELVDFAVNESGEAMIEISELTKLDALATGWAEFHAKIKRWREGLPAFVLVG